MVFNYRIFDSGICLLYKQRGVTPPRPTRKRACVGKCHHEKVFNLPAQKVKVNLYKLYKILSIQQNNFLKRYQRPCVGICFYLKMKNKTSPESNHPMYQNK